MPLFSFMEIANKKCPPLATLTTNFQKYVENEVNNECNYIKDGTLHYIEYDIPTAYIARYGSEKSIKILDKFLKSIEVGRVPFFANYTQFWEPNYKRIKYLNVINENMYAYYRYKIDDDFNNGDKYFVNLEDGTVHGILFPIVIKKTNDFNDDTDDSDGGDGDGDECKK